MSGYTKLRVAHERTNGTVWIRPTAMFNQSVYVEGTRMDRFTYVGPRSASAEESGA